MVVICVNSEVMELVLICGIVEIVWLVNVVLIIWWFCIFVVSNVNGSCVVFCYINVDVFGGSIFVGDNSMYCFL